MKPLELKDQALIEEVNSSSGLSVGGSHGSSQLTVMYVSAKPGDPSTLWQSPNTGLWYRKKDEALTDKGTPVDPDSVEILKSWIQRNKKTVTIIVVAAVVVLYYLISTKKIVL